MGWLDSLVTGLFGAGQQAAGMAFDASQAKKNRDFQSEEAELNRIFQSEEAALQRNWSSQEAEQARDWQEEMYAKYNSLSGKIAQAEQAGVNPMFAVTGGAVSPMNSSSSAPGGVSAGSVGTPSGSAASASLLNILGAVLDARKVESEIDLNKSEAERNRADAEQTGKETSWIDKLNEAELENMLMSTTKIQADVHVSEETANKLSAESNKLRAEGIRISKITDSEVRLSEANALLAEFESSVAKIIDDKDSASTEDYVTAGAYLLSKIIGLGVQLSPKGIVRLN